MVASHLFASLTVSLQSFFGLQTPSKFPTFAFSEVWNVLGPWQLGTREAAWDADPLNYHGGFHHLEVDNHTRFKSSFASNASVKWTSTKANLGRPNTQYASADLSISFPEVDWPFLQQVYGWAALQWQAWARGEILVQSKETRTLTLNLEHILELWVDDQQYFGGDFYGYGRAPIVLHLEPGIHRIDVRLVRDVRAMGGITKSPSLDIKLELQLWNHHLHQSGEVLLPDRLGDEYGPLASSYASVMLRNDHNETIYIVDLEPPHNICEMRLLAQTPIKLVPGQSRPINLELACIPGTAAYYAVNFHFRYETETSRGQAQNTLFVTGYPRIPQPRDGPHLITFLHPAGIVSYAILRPPPLNAECGNERKLPVLLQLHGAGLEADEDMVKHALDSIQDLCAWILFPTGVTPWSGDDWHTWGRADVEAAVAAIPDWINQVEWPGPGVDTDRWLVSGHSNGGQGTWYVLTHSPDKVIAAAPVSGYSSIQNYVPYTFWHTADPGRSAVVQASLNSYRHELLLENAKDIPVLQQHGSADDNVPAYHSRLLSQTIQQAGAWSDYAEIPGRGHWWDGVMTTEHLSAFYRRHLASDKTTIEGAPLNLRNFSIVTANPADTDSKNGARILLLELPGQLGRLDFLFDPLTKACVCWTSNVRTFRLPSAYHDCSWAVLDGQKLETGTKTKSSGQLIMWKSDEDGWSIESHTTLDGWRPPQSVRWGRQLGTIDSIVRTNGSFQIVQHSETAGRVALQISRNLCQYFAADTEITTVYEDALATSGNLISVAVGTDLPEAPLEVSHAIKISEKGLEVRTSNGASRFYPSQFESEDGLAAIFLRPLKDERLELVIWGADAKSLGLAARLVPLMTGTGQPDFVVTDRRMLWKGLEGTLALGFFDERWNASSNSFFT